MPVEREIPEGQRPLLTPRSPSPPSVLVTGAAGFIGRRVVSVLLERGVTVRALVRRPIPELSAMGVSVAIGDVRDRDLLHALIPGCDAVVHLAAAMRDEPWSEDVNVGGVRNLISACQSKACQRLIIISTQSTKILQKGLYAETKARADALALSSGLATTVLMPSIVYGEALEGVFGVLHRAVSRLPIVPVLGNGRWRSAPVHVDDVARAVADCLAVPGTSGRSYDIAGPDSVTFDDLIDGIAAALGMNRKPKLHLPFSVALVTARILARVLRNPPITLSNVLGSNQETSIDIDPARRDFAFEPAGLDEGLRRVFTAEPYLDGLMSREAVLFSRYLLGTDPAPPMVDRYVVASRRLFPEPPERLTRFCRHHPSAIPFLDAATSRSRNDLRRRILLMATILEASPEHAERFLPSGRSLARTTLTVLWAAIAGVIRAVLGFPLALVLRER